MLVHHYAHGLSVMLLEIPLCVTAGSQRCQLLWSATADLDSALKSLTNGLTCFGSCSWIRSKKSKPAGRKEVADKNLCVCVGKLKLVYVQHLKEACAGLM